MGSNLSQFKEGAKLTRGCVIFFPGYFDSVRTFGQAPLSCDRDLDSGPFPPLSRGTNFFHTENLASC